MPEPTYGCESVFVARQPVFNPDETTWGYELLFRTGEGNTAIISDQSHATASVIADGLTMALEGMPHDARILINFPEQLLLDGVGFVLPKENCIVEILEDVRPSEEVLAAVRNLKEAGYTIAVDDFFGQEELMPFMELADIVKIDILELDSDPKRVAEAIRNLPTKDVTLLAEKVEEQFIFNGLKSMGFSLFQGFFFSKPEIIPGKRLSSNEATKLQLLSELSQTDFHPKRLAEILKSDPNLTYRLFRYINSVNFGLRAEVTSLKRAIDMMGLLKAKHWLRVAILADVNTSSKAGELTFMAVQRAKFLESLCTHAPVHTCAPDTMFIIGLFSLLDAMLGISMEEILEKLPLDESVVQGLTEEGEIQELLNLIKSYERGDWAETSAKLKVMGQTPQEADALYISSRNWTQEMLGLSQPGSGQECRPAKDSL